MFAAGAGLPSCASDILDGIRHQPLWRAADVVYELVKG